MKEREFILKVTFSQPSPQSMLKLPFRKGGEQSEHFKGGAANFKGAHNCRWVVIPEFTVNHYKNYTLFKLYLIFEMILKENQYTMFPE